MSTWQTYIEDRLTGTGNVSGAAVISANGGGVWASKDLNIRPGEGVTINRLFGNPGDAFAKGITVAGTKYMALKADPTAITGNKGAAGVILGKTAQAIVIGYYSDNAQQGNAATEVLTCVDQLKEGGW